MEAARALAQRTLLQYPVGKETADDTAADRIDADRIDAILKRVLARPASNQEREILLRGLNRTRGQFADGSKDALALVAVGESTRDERIAPNELAAWTNLCLAILNLDETLNRE